MFGQRSGDAQDDRVHIGQPREVGGRLQTLGARRLYLGVLDAEDVRPPGFKVGDLLLVDVEASDLESGSGEQQRQRQSNISQADDSDVCGAAFQAVEALLGYLR